jgi:ABC-2 type transport system permease protein
VIGSSAAASADLVVSRTVVALFAMASAGYALVFGPMVARQDLRLDLPNADILKTYPLRGWQIVLGEWLTPVAIITVLLWLLVLTAALNVEADGVERVGSGVRIGAAIGAALLTPFVCGLMVLVMNAAVVLFPAWVQTSVGRPGGIDVLGQRIFFLAGLFLVMTAALVPAALGAAVTFLVVQWIAGIPVAAICAVAMVIAILGVEIGAGIWWLGRRFESFDLSAELRP